MQFQEEVQRCTPVWIVVIEIADEHRTQCGQDGALAVLTLCPLSHKSTALPSQTLITASRAR